MCQKLTIFYALREINAGRLDILRKVTNAAPLHEFTFESSAGRHICFVMDVLSYGIPGLQSKLNNPLLGLNLVLGLTKHILKGLEYLHDECEVIHSGRYCAVFLVIGWSNILKDLKPANILLLPYDIDEVVEWEISRQPARLYGVSKAILSEKLPVPSVMSAPLTFVVDPSKGIKFHLVWSTVH